MSKPLVVFASDQTYLGPLMAPCLQFVDRGLTELADVVVYLVDVDPDIRRRLEDYFTPRGIRFETLESSALERAAGTLQPNHRLPAVAFARLAIADLIPSRHDTIIYLDCDIQIVGDISPLLKHSVPEGAIVAARSYVWLVSPGGEVERRTGEYLAKLGGVPRDAYFNSGVMACRRETWREIAPKALDFFVNNPQLCGSMDQSALNAVCVGRLVQMSPAYNFISGYSASSIHKHYKPRLIHFTGATKPWNSIDPPWNGRFLADYARVLNLFPFLRGGLEFRPPQSLIERAATRLRRGLSSARHPRSALRKALRDRDRNREMLHKFLEYTNNTEFPF